MLSEVAEKAWDYTNMLWRTSQQNLFPKEARVHFLFKIIKNTQDSLLFSWIKYSISVTVCVIYLRISWIHPWTHSVYIHILHDRTLGLKTLFPSVLPYNFKKVLEQISAGALCSMYWSTLRPKYILNIDVSCLHFCTEIYFSPFYAKHRRCFV